MVAGYAALARFLLAGRKVEQHQQEFVLHQLLVEQMLVVIVRILVFDTLESGFGSGKAVERIDLIEQKLQIRGEFGHFFGLPVEREILNGAAASVRISKK